MDIATFKEELPKAELLAKVVRIFEAHGRVYVSKVREFRHTDNIMLFLGWCKKIKLKKHFLFETVDLYESKNIPKVIYCLHGLALFLNKRGLGRGIVVNENVVFTHAENRLFEDAELGEISMGHYDDIYDKLDSEESDVEVETALRRSVATGSPSGSALHHPPPSSEVVEKTKSFIKNFGKTLAWVKAHEALQRDSVSVSVLRKFIDFDLKGEEAHRTIAELQNEIVGFFKQNSIKEIERDSLLHTIRLFHENLNALRSVPSGSFPAASNYQTFKEVLYRLIHDYKLCFEISNSGLELPFRMLFPDNAIGDFHFSRFISSNFEFQDQLIEVARAHFISSGVFREISNAYATGASLEMNPIVIKQGLPESDGPRRGLIDDAIGSEAVRDEIIRRAQLIIEFINSKFDFLLNVEFPYYVRMFSRHPQFFSSFIEPAIFSSGNSVAAELMAYIFSSSSLSTPTRLYKEDKRFIRTTSIGYSDYAPLKEYLDKCTPSFKEALLGRLAPTPSVDEYFSSHAIEDILQVETSVEELNSLAAVLKRSTGLMSEEMKGLVHRLGPVHGPAEGSAKIQVFSQTEGVVSADVSLRSEEREPGVFKEVRFKNRRGSRRSGCPTERFILRLDNQFAPELDENYSLALAAVLKDLKYRTMLLISVSEGRTLDAVVNDQGLVSELPELDIISLRDAVTADIALLRKRGLFKTANGHAELLAMIAADILACKYKLCHAEISMNLETSDALFHKAAVLDKCLHSLYSYLDDLTKAMFVNKSGVFFNRESKPYSKYGTYVVPLNALKGHVYENVRNSEVDLRISCREPAVLKLIAMLGDVNLCEPVLVRFDTLLKMREENVLSFDVGEVCRVSVGAMIELINERYINY